MRPAGIRYRRSRADPGQLECSPGATTPAQAQVVEGGVQQLSAPAGQNLAAPTPDSFKGSLVTGQATGAVMDLSLDDAIARGLRQNLGLILQTTAQQNAKSQQYQQLQAHSRRSLAMPQSRWSRPTSPPSG